MNVVGGVMTIRRGWESQKQRGQQIKKGGPLSRCRSTTKQPKGNSAQATTLLPRSGFVLRR